MMLTKLFRARNLISRNKVINLGLLTQYSIEGPPARRIDISVYYKRTFSVNNKKILQKII